MSWNPAIEPGCPDEVGIDAIEMLIVPRARDIGGFEVRRALPSPKRQMVGPFIFFDQAGPALARTAPGLIEGVKQCAAVRIQRSAMIEPAAQVSASIDLDVERHLPRVLLDIRLLAAHDAAARRFDHFLPEDGECGGGDGERRHNRQKR